ncbi:uncharacterized protein BX664DRAFT_333597 [Halteromyces radiatus]|uniref:uncharacterized protein n=1 Tax=Halteromyces radiatus TaxID=101107 RepID=UPI0022207F8C|nr:uncharacterized protein BX664DRAFT_333597 [Halteromyces radiatus]KAI8089668.1 hypothetical protein BX664DRAFT_333597 [Halteromyces radiatus]
MPLFSKKITPTTITKDIEKMTDSNQTEVDWALVFQICEVVNNSELGAKEARKLLQKKMLANDVNTQVISLEILNALSENCREKFKGQLAAKSFGEDLETLATQKASNDDVHSKLVQCLQNWVSNDGTDPAFGTICRVHELVMHGVSQPVKSGRLGGNLFKPYQLQSSATRNDITAATGGKHNNEYQQPRLNKPVDIMSDVEIAKNNAQLLSQTLSFTDPTQEDITKNELIQEFYGKCKMLQRVISGHLQTCEDSELISALILANGELVNTFKAYDDMLERRALDAATNNSRAVNHRSTRQDETLINTENDASGTNTHVESSTSGGGSSSSGAQLFTSNTNAPSSGIDPFDPFADSNQTIQNQASSEHNGTALPPPLTPQKLHD